MAFTWEDLGNALGGGAKALGNTLYSVTPADNVMNIIREVRKPGPTNWGTVGKNVAGGAIDVAMFALPAARAGKLAYATGAALPRVAARGLTSGSTSAFVVPAVLNYGLGRLTGPQAVAQASAPVTGFSPRFATKVPERSTASFKSAGAGQPYYQSGPYGATPVTTYTDDAGRIHTWNPTSKIYEVTGFGTPAGDTKGGGGGGGGGAGAAGGAATGALPALDPRVQAQLDAARRQAVSAKERTLADIATRGTQLSLGAAQEQRGAGRRARGSFLDLMSGLAELGYTGSPAMSSVGQEAIAAREAAQRASVARELASGRAQLGQETVATQQNLRNILDRLAAEELAARAYASFEGLQNYYGGK